MIKTGVFLLCIFLVSPLYADDSGNRVSMSVNDLFLQLTGRAGEYSQGGFDTPQWKLGGEAHFSNALELNVTVGASSLLYRPNWAVASQETISLIEAKGLYRTGFADFYAGQFLLPWGSEGAKEENELYFPRTLLYEKGLFPLRDMGEGAYAQADGFYFNVAAHSGEGGGLQGNSDNRVFITGQWGYLSPNRVGAGLSVTGGRYLSTSLLETKIRGGNLFFNFHFFNVFAEIEGSVLENFINGVESDQLAWHGDLTWQLSDAFNMMGRYEQYNPNTKMNLNVQGRGIVGFELHNKTSTSRLFLHLIKNNESLLEYPNDEVRLSWRITPL